MVTAISAAILLGVDIVGYLFRAVGLINEPCFFWLQPVC